MKELKLNSDITNLNEVLEIVDSEIMNRNCSKKFVNEVNLAVEEVFANISHYAYQPGSGEVTIKVSSEHMLMIEFVDAGIPFNPLEKDNPDITLSAEERENGGLGVFIIRKMMDNVTYRYENGKNILTLIKLF